VHGEVYIGRIHRRLDPHLEVMSLTIARHGPARGKGKAKKAMIRHGLVPREERGAVVMYEAQCLARKDGYPSALRQPL
jgi:hypothetical protein